MDDNFDLEEKTEVNQSSLTKENNDNIEHLEDSEPIQEVENNEEVSENISSVGDNNDGVNPNNLKQGFGRNEFAKRAANNNYYKEQGKKLEEEKLKAKEAQRSAREEKENEYKKKPEEEHKENGNVNKKNEINAERTTDKKSKADKKADNKNLSKANANKAKVNLAGVGNKINDLKSKAYMAKNPKEAATTIAKEQAKKKVKQVIIQFITKNPYVLGILALLIIVPILFFVIFSYFGLDLSGSNNNYYGLYGYSYVDDLESCDTYTVTDSDGNLIISGIELEDFVAVTLVSEAGQFSESEEMLKAQAVAIRSVILNKTSANNCTITTSTIAYNTSKTEAALEEGSIYQSAVDSTRGIVLYNGSSVVMAYFAAICGTGQTNGDSYVTLYGSEFFDTAQEQLIPIDIVDAESPTDSWLSDGCSGSHDWGLSQYGAYYLGYYENYSFEEILDYYYGTSYELVSIYQSAIYSGDYTGTNFTVETSSGLTDVITSSLLSMYGENWISNYNQYIYDTVIETGIGTREAVVMTAISLVLNLYEQYGIRLPYTYGGGHSVINQKGVYGAAVSSYYGIDPEWGEKFTSTYYYYLDNGDVYTYNYFGLDCSAFVFWSIKNAGFNINYGYSETFKDYGTRYALNDSSYVILPGDLLYTTGHIMLVVGVDYDNQLVYIAHQNGGSQGLRISTISMSNTSYEVVSMQEYYDTTSTYTEEEFYDIYFSNTLVN